jgi:predicted DNA-binding protein YlxM (UPF0122 family)
LTQIRGKLLKILTKAQIRLALDWSIRGFSQVELARRRRCSQSAIAHRVQRINSRLLRFGLQPLRRPRRIREADFDDV